MPYVGNGVLASALGMDKHFTKSVLQAAGRAGRPVGDGVARAAGPRARAVGPPHPGTGSARVREARARRIECRREQGARLGRAGCRPRHRVRRGSHRAGRVRHRGTRGRVRRAAGARRGPDAGERRGRDRLHRARVLRLRRQVPRCARYRAGLPGRPETRRARGDAADRRARLRRDRRTRARAGRLLLHRHRLHRERDQHDAGVHADLDVPGVLAGERAELPRPDHRADRAGPRDPR